MKKFYFRQSYDHESGQIKTIFGCEEKRDGNHKYCSIIITGEAQRFAEMFVKIANDSAAAVEREFAKAAK